MSNLILPQKWTSQPQTPVGIDWSNPLVQALGLVDVWIPSNGLLTPTLIRKFTPVVSVGNFSQGVNASGRSLQYTTSTNDNGLILANDADELFPVANTTSIFVIRQSLDTTARTSTLFGYHVGTTGPDRTLAHAPFSDGNIYWDLGDTTTAHRISVASGGKTANKEAYAFIGGPTKGREIWRNGRKLAGDATKTGARSSTTGSFRIGSASNTTTEASDLEGVNLFIIGSKEWPDWAIKALSDNPWQIFNPQSRRIFVASAGGAAALASNAAAQASASAAATTAIPIAGAALSIASATGSMTTAIPLSGSAASVSTASGALTAQIKLSAAALAQAVANAALSSGIILTASAVSQAAAQGTLASAIQMIANAAAQATASASLTAGGGLSANAAAQATASAALTVQIQIAASALAQAAASASLTTGGGMSANALAAANANGMLTTQITLTAAALAQAIASGGLTASINLSASALSSASASAVLAGPAAPVSSVSIISAPAHRHHQPGVLYGRRHGIRIAP